MLFARPQKVGSIPPGRRGGQRACGRSVARVLLASLGVVAGGCAGGPVPRPDAVTPVPATLEPGDADQDIERLYAAQGRRAVIPVPPPRDLSPQDRVRWRPDSDLNVILEDGSTLPSRLYRVTPRPEPDVTAWARWLPPRIAWDSEPAERSRDHTPDASGPAPAWVAVVDMPTGIPERRLPRFARVGGRIVDITWLPPARQNPDLGRAARPPATEASLRALGELLRSEAIDPQRRWRIRLLTQRFSPSELWGDTPPPGFGGTESGQPEPLEAVAEQLELNARASIDALRRVDSVLAMRVVNRLTAVMRTPDGTLLPSWPLGDGAAGGTAVLIGALLDPRSGADAKADAARLWLNSTPGAHSWIIDDIGHATLEGGVARLVPHVGVADLSGEGGQAVLSSNVAFAGEQLRSAVAPAQGISLRAPFSAGSGERPVLEVSMGDYTAVLNPVSGAVPVTPPGARLGPLLEPWTLATWRAREPVPVGTARSVELLVQRAPGGGWEAALRCGPGMPGASDVVRLWFGARDSARGLIEVRRGGAARVNTPGSKGTPIDAATWEDAQGWGCVVPIDDALQEPGGAIIIGLERECPEGVRAAFPRPMMPGQPEPGRLLLDMSAWGGVPEP